MKKLLCFSFMFLLISPKAHADFWGGDLPLLAEIVSNTLKTLHEMEKQSDLLEDEMDGIKDRIDRVRTIAELVQPSSWEQWKDPQEALRRLKVVYYTLPKEYRSEKADAVEEEISKAMSATSRIGPEAHTSFLSGKELERRGADASPGVAQKLSASGIGTLVAMEAQSQVIESHITSLLAQMLADANEKESRSIVAKGKGLSEFSKNLNQSGKTFSNRAMAIGGTR